MAALMLGGCSLFDETPAPATPSASVAAPPPAVETLHPGDAVRILVTGEDELSGVFPLAADGTLHLELLGTVPAAGLTPAALRDSLRQKLMAGYLKDPQVMVSRAEAQKPLMAGIVPPPPPLRASDDR